MTDDLLSGTRSPGRRTVLAGMLLVLLLSAGLRILCWRGLMMSDPGTYTSLAYSLSKGTPRFEGAAAPRLGVYGPVALIFRFFPITDLTAPLYPFLLSVLTSVLVYILYLRLTDDVLGAFLAGACHACLPIEVATSTVLLPEAPLAFFSCLGVLLCVCAGRHQGKRQIGVALLAGMSLGVGLTIKMSVLMVMPVLLVYLLTERARVVSALAFLGGILFCIALEMLVFWKCTGDPLFHYHAVSAAQGRATAIVGEQFLQSLQLYLQIITTSPEFIGLYLVTLVGMPFLVRRPWLPLAWLVTGFLILEFASSSLTRYVPVPHSSRYLSVLSPAVCITAVMACRFPIRKWDGAWWFAVVGGILGWGFLLYLLDRWWNDLFVLLFYDHRVSVVAVCVAFAVAVAWLLVQRNRRSILPCMALLPIVLALTVGATHSVAAARRYRKLDNVRHAHEFLKEAPPTQVVTDSATGFGLWIRWGFEPPCPITAFDDQDLAGLASGTAVVINWRELNSQLWFFQRQPPEILARDKWPREWESALTHDAGDVDRRLVIARVKRDTEGG